MNLWWWNLGIWRVLVLHFFFFFNTMRRFNQEGLTSFNSIWLLGRRWNRITFTSLQLHYESRVASDPYHKPGCCHTVLCHGRCTALLHRHHGTIYGRSGLLQRSVRPCITMTRGAVGPSSWSSSTKTGVEASLLSWLSNLALTPGEREREILGHDTTTYWTHGTNTTWSRGRGKWRSTTVPSWSRGRQSSIIYLQKQ